MKDSEVNVFVTEDSLREPKWRPDSCWSWLVCAASSVSIVIVSGIGYSFGLLLPPLIEHFETTRQATAWIGSLHMACGYLLSPFGSYSIDRFSYRFTAMVGSLSGLLGFFLASLSSELWVMYPTYGFMASFGYRMVYNSSLLVVLQYFARWRSLAVGIVTSATAIGIFVITQITQALLCAFGWRWTLKGFALMYFVCGLCSTVFVPIDKLKDKRSEYNVAAKPRQKEARNSPLFKNRSFLVFLTSLIVLYLGYYVPTIHIIKHCKQELHISEEKSSMLFIYLATASFFSRHLFCKLGDLRYFNRFHLYQGGVTISGVCVLCLPLARSFDSVVTIFMVFGLVEGAAAGQLPLLVLECAGEQKVNQAWGYIMVFMGLSIGIGPPMAGLMADKLGSYAPSFYTAGAVMIAGAFIASPLAFMKP